LGVEAVDWQGVETQEYFLYFKFSQRRQVGWIAELSKSDHPVHTLFDSVKGTVAGVSCGCAEVFGATEEVGKSAFEFVKDNAVPGTAGLPSLRKLASEGYTILSF
jgi:hypothetical protein